MPRRGKKTWANISRHGTEAGQQIRVEEYKEIKKYKLLKKVNDELSNKIRFIYENNHWNLMEVFKELKEYLKEIGNSGKIAWENDIQYLDFKSRPPKILNDISLERMKNGEYASLLTDKKPNTKETEATYAKRIEYLTNTIEGLKQFHNAQNLQWMVDNNRLLLYEILKYHSDARNSIPTLNRDLKVVVRMMKLLMKGEHEIRYKFSALQIAITDIENFSDDLNTIKSKHELNNFIPYEQLLDLCDKLEEEYKDSVEKLNTNIREDGTKHPPDVFYRHMLHLAVALYVWDYPSRKEKLKMDFISNIKDAEPNNNYVLITKQEQQKRSYKGRACDVKLIFNEVVKDHKPIQYNLKSMGLESLNLRLCNLLKYSLKTYPRKHLFVNKNAFKSNTFKKLSPGTVSDWLSGIYKTKNLGVDTFRESFVSYYFTKINNRQRKVMSIRMRTSMDIILRSYFKFYLNPVILAKVKIEPDADVLKRANEGTTKENAIQVENNAENIQPAQQPVQQPAQERVTERNEIVEKVPNPERKKERNRDNFKKWYNNEDNKKKLNEKHKDNKTYAKRYVRELNNNKLDFEKMQEETKIKYQLYYDEDNDTYNSRLLN